MGEKKEKKGFLGKLKDILSGAPDTAQSNESEPASPYAPKEKVPNDIEFAQRFTESGGHFLFCKSGEEALSNLRNILSEVDSSVIFCPDPKLKDYLKKANFKIEENSPLPCNVVCTTCEALVAYTGSIMIDGFQTKGLKISNLPPIHVVWGYTGQIVENLSAAMSKINNTYRGDERPSQISTLKGPQAQSVQQAAADPNKGRVLYLLLLEDPITE
ncbi:MAG: lactate utilization protein [Bacteroidota bacterium]|nr:lactate utilization protein [Bacteroidota bacterium]MDX5429017.1 lactate utilization protein [Bacteroidota bacterium]MDX5447792.1 lactate utilization protein [Bacteroidota bacterium]MDX5506681.1 lactate utilization protein [Bacteroidota bacterium]